MSQTETFREPCFSCGEPAALQARICPHCRGSLLVKLHAGKLPETPKARYELAKKVAALGAPLPPFAAIVHGFESPAFLLARGLTREVCQSLAGRLAAEGLETDTVPENLGGPEKEGFLADLASSHRQQPWILPLVFALAVGAVLFAFHLFRPKPSKEPVVAVVSKGGHPVEIGIPGFREPSPETPRKVVDRALATSVQVRSNGSLGSGFFVTPELVITNRHVVAGDAGGVEVVVGDRTLKAFVQNQSDWLDLALLRVPGGQGNAVDLGDALKLRAGDKVWAIGNPNGLEFSLIEGLVSQPVQPLLGMAYIQIDGNVQPGNSGGPLFDADARLVGIVSMKGGVSGFGLAIPVNYLYDENTAWLKPPSPAPDAKAWRQVLARVNEKDSEEAYRARLYFEKPALMQASLAPDGRITATILKYSMTPPLPESLQVRLTKANDVCRGSGMAEQWQKVDSSANAPDFYKKTRQWQWLEKHNLLGDIYSARVVIVPEGCSDRVPRGWLLTLEGAAPGADSHPL